MSVATAPLSIPVTFIPLWIVANEIAEERARGEWIGSIPDEWTAQQACISFPHRDTCTESTRAALQSVLSRGNSKSSHTLFIRNVALDCETISGMSRSTCALVCASVVVAFMTLRCTMRPPSAASPDQKAAAPIVKRSAFFDFDLGPLRGNHNQEVPPLHLFDDVVINAVGTRIERAGEGFVWIGEVRNERPSQVILSVQGNVMSGSVRTAAGKIYDIHTDEKGRFLARELNATAFPKDDVNRGPSSADLAPLGDSGTPCGGTDFGNIIDVLVGYTDAALQALNSQAGVESEIYAGVAEANQTFINTRMSQRLNVVGLYHVADKGTGDSCQDVTALHDDLKFDDLFKRRNTAGADVVFLVEGPLKSTSDFDEAGKRIGCTATPKNVRGEAYGVLDPNDIGWAPHAFVVIDANYLAKEFTLAHELGHLLGARHDNDLISTPFPEGHGFVGTTCRDRSVMAVDQTHTRVPYWSNTIELPCKPFGSSTENNANAIGRSSPNVATFRCSSPGRTDVWMRDTWNDDGVEPNATQESVWTSPYIWVRRTQDVNRVKQHQHETPFLDTSVWVYVKVHNGGASATSGQLDLFFADSGTGLAFPSTWTLIGTQQVQLGARDTRSPEFPWHTPAQTPSGAGHFAFLAQWTSTADTIAYTGPDVEKMTRDSNNVVLRNLEIIEDPIHPHAVVVVRNLRAVDDRVPAGPTTIRIAPPADEINGSFFFYGKAFITLGPEMAKAWHEAGRPGSGFVEEDTRLRITAPEGAVLTNIQIARQDTIRIDFERTPTTPARTFHVEVSQQIGEKTFGGVTYELPPP